MTRLLFLFFITVVQLTFGQNIQPTKAELFKVFKKSIRQDTKGKVATNSNPWVICNKDSQFYKSDTLILYNDVNYYYHSKCCDFIDWTFYKKDAFVLTRIQICKEPTTASVTKNADWFTFNISNRDKDLYFETINQGKIISKYKVVSIDKENYDGQINDGIVVTLVRVHKL